MLKDLENSFSLLEKRVVRLKKQYDDLAERHAELSKEFEEMRERYDEERRKNQGLAEEYKNIKLHAAMSGNPEHNRLMKNYINRLIKEVDTCIAQLQNSGL